MFGLDLRFPTEAALLPSEPVSKCESTDYKEELIISLSSALELAAINIQGSQQCGKRNYDKRVFTKKLRIGDWVPTGREWETMQAV